MRERVSLGWLEIAGSRAQGKQVFSNKNHFLILKKKKKKETSVQCQHLGPESPLHTSWPQDGAGGGGAGEGSGVGGPKLKR